MEVNPLTFIANTSRPIELGDAAEWQITLSWRTNDCQQWKMRVSAPRPRPRLCASRLWTELRLWKYGLRLSANTQASKTQVWPFQACLPQKLAVFVLSSSLSADPQQWWCHRQSKVKQCPRCIHQRKLTDVVDLSLRVCSNRRSHNVFDSDASSSTQLHIEFPGIPDVRNFIWLSPIKCLL